MSLTNRQADDLKTLLAQTITHVRNECQCGCMENARVPAAVTMVETLNELVDAGTGLRRAE